MVQDRSSRTSIRLTNSVKRIVSRLITSEQAAIDDELAALEQAIRHLSFTPLPAALIPSRVPSNAPIASFRASFFERPVHLDFVAGWAKGPVIEWYERHRSKGSTLIRKMQLRKDRQHPYYHEYIVVFTQGGHTYRVDRRPDPDVPFDTIIRSGCKPYDTIQRIESLSLRELENTSDCVVELGWHNKPTIDLLFLLSICFALMQDEQAKQYTLQRYDCCFLSWVIIMVTVRATATWETRLGEVMYKAILRTERKTGCHVALSRVDNAWTLGRYVEYHSWHYIELALALARVWVLVRTRQGFAKVDPPQDLTLDLAFARVWAPEPSQVRALVRMKLWELERLEQGREWKKEGVRAQWSELGWKHDTIWPHAGLDLDLKHDLGLVQELVLQLMRLVLGQCVDAISKLLLPTELDVWQSTILQNMQRRFLSQPLKGLGEEIFLVRHKMEEEADELVQSTVSKLAVLPARLSISLTYENTNPDKVKVHHRHAHKATHRELEQHMMKFLANHGRRIARWGLAPAAEVEQDMLDGMNRIWLSVSQHHTSISHAPEEQT